MRKVGLPDFCLKDRIPLIAGVVEVTMSSLPCRLIEVDSRLPNAAYCVDGRGAGYDLETLPEPEHAAEIIIIR
jgi:hypothetical protein